MPFQATDIGIQTDALVPGSLNMVAQESIIAHLNFVYTHQNWSDTKAKYNALNARLAKFSCCGVRRNMAVDVEGVRVSRRDAFRLADELFLDGAAFYRRAELFNLNVQQELVKAVEAIKHDRMVSIVAMLREQGNMTVTVEHLKSVVAIFHLHLHLRCTHNCAAQAEPAGGCTDPSKRDSDFSRFFFFFFFLPSRALALGSLCCCAAVCVCLQEPASARSGAVAVRLAGGRVDGEACARAGGACTHQVRRGENLQAGKEGWQGSSICAGIRLLDDAPR